MRAMNESAEYEDCQYEQGSPCTSEGLHMPNSQSLINFTRKVRTHARMRYNSVCTPYPVLSAGTSPIEGPSFMMSSKMRRISSCPNMKRLDEKDEHKKQVQDNKVRAFFLQRSLKFQCRIIFIMPLIQSAFFKLKTSMCSLNQISLKIFVTLRLLL